jgi:hypothetical protein
MEEGEIGNEQIILYFIKGEVKCRMEIRNREEKVMATKEAQNLGHILVTRLGLAAAGNSK